MRPERVTPKTNFVQYPKISFDIPYPDMDMGQCPTSQTKFVPISQNIP